MISSSTGALNSRSSTPARTSSAIRSARCRRGRRRYLQEFADDVEPPRRARLARGLVGDRAGRRATCWRRFWACRRGTISMHQNVTVAQGIIASCFSLDGAAPQDRADRSRVPDQHYLFEGFRRYGAEIVVRAVATIAIRSDLDRLLDAIDERTVLVPLSLVLFRSACIQDARRGDREGAPRRRARHPRRLSGRGHRADGPRGARRRLRRRRLGEVAVRRAGRRLSLRPARSARDARARRSSAGPRTPRRSSSRPARCATPTDRAVPERHAECPGARTRRAPATRSSARSACRRSARSRCALTRRMIDHAARAGLSPQHARSTTPSAAAP